MDRSFEPIPLRSPLSKKISIPLTTDSISAGFPSPADDYLDVGIDLNEHLIQHPASTFFLHVNGSSMTNTGIHDGDLLIVDKSLNPEPGNVVVAVLDGSFTVKRLVHEKGKVYLTADSPNYQPINLRYYSDVYIWGVAIYSIHTINRNKKYSNP